MDSLPTLPIQDLVLAGPRYADGAYYKAPTTWRRCGVCSHHAYIAVDTSICPTCETY